MLDCMERVLGVDLAWRGLAEAGVAATGEIGNLGRSKMCLSFYNTVTKSSMDIFLHCFIAMQKPRCLISSRNICFDIASAF